MEASEGGVEDCTGSEYSFVETSGETVSGAAASGSASSGAAAPGAAASGADRGTEAVGDGVRKHFIPISNKSNEAIKHLTLVINCSLQQL